MKNVLTTIAIVALAGLTVACGDDNQVGPTSTAAAVCNFNHPHVGEHSHGAPNPQPIPPTPPQGPPAPAPPSPPLPAPRPCVAGDCPVEVPAPRPCVAGDCPVEVPVPPLPAPRPCVAGDCPVEVPVPPLPTPPVPPTTPPVPPRPTAASCAVLESSSWTDGSPSGQDKFAGVRFTFKNDCAAPVRVHGAGGKNRNIPVEVFAGDVLIGGKFVKAGDIAPGAVSDFFEKTVKLEKGWLLSDVTRISAAPVFDYVD